MSDESDSQEGTLTEILPLKSLDELLEWKEESIGKFVRPCDLKNYDPKCKEGPMTLVCHDMKGGYLDDRFVNGRICDSDQYWLWNWWNIHIFVYFSHNFITIPPLGWIHVAHKHGVRVLGTLITEWDEGAGICSKLLASQHLIKLAAENLAKIAKAFNFDGWLVNIENGIKFDHLEKLKTLVSLINNECVTQLGDESMVLWYDSVIASSGRLKWQDELNKLNRPFMDCCGGIFLNYNYIEDSLRSSLAELQQSPTNLSQEMDRSFGPQTIFVGVDVFGRGCMGVCGANWIHRILHKILRGKSFVKSGGYACDIPLKMIKRYKMSCAIFAPGWVYETQSIHDFHRNNNRFWTLIQENIGNRSLMSLPLDTKFTPACRKNESGKYEYNLNTQDIVPNLNIPFDEYSFLADKKRLGLGIKVTKNNTMLRLFSLCLTNPISIFVDYASPCDQDLTVKIYLKMMCNNGKERTVFSEAMPEVFDGTTARLSLHLSQKCDWIELREMGVVINGEHILTDLIDVYVIFNRIIINKVL